MTAGVQVYVPAIVAFELRRELLRIDSATSVANLERFIATERGRYLLLTDANLFTAAKLWAAARKQGRPTADRFALDIDVILAAQALGLQLPDDQYVVATDNVGHLSQFVPAKPWHEI